jgi:hypothetical protein
VFRPCLRPPDTSRARAPHQPTGDRAGKYSGVLDCFVKTARNDGPLAFYNGFMPNFARLGSWNIAMFLVLEQMKKVVAPKTKEA